MKIVRKTTECLRGERFYQIMSGFDFDEASQIVVLLYRSSSDEFDKAFVKVADPKYPNASLITLNDDSKMLFTVDTTDMSQGKYEVEIRIDIIGISAPIIKDRSDFLIVKESRT